MFTRMKFLLFIFAFVVVLIPVLTGTVFGALNNTYAGHPVAKVTVNGAEISSDVPAVVMNGRVLVPLRVIGEALGAAAEWDAVSRAVHITAGEAETPDRWPIVQGNIQNEMEIVALGVDWDGKMWLVEGAVQNNTSEVVYCGAKLNNIERDGTKREVDFVFAEPSFLGPGDVGIFKFMIDREIVEKNHVFKIEFLWARQE